MILFELSSSWELLSPDNGGAGGGGVPGKGEVVGKITKFLFLI